MSFICMRMKTHFHIKGGAPNLVLIQRPGGTRKLPILRNPLKFAFMTIFGCKTLYLGSDVMVLYLQLVVRNWVIQCAAVRCSLFVQEDLTGEQALIRFLV